MTHSDTDPAVNPEPRLPVNSPGLTAGGFSPYLLPDGNVQIAFSGGRTSAYMLHQILEANGGLPDRAVVSFQNTGREMPETLDFVQEVGDRWGVRIVWLEYRLHWTGAPHNPADGVFDYDAHSFAVVNHNSASRNGEPMSDLLEYYGFIPPAISRWCTGRLKVKTGAKYLSGLGWDEWSTATGIRADESHRGGNAGVKKDRSTPWLPLMAGGVTKRDVAAFWMAHPFDLRLPNIKGRTQLGNCDGCFLKSEAARAALARDYPERAAWWADMESRYGGTFGKHGGWAGLVSFLDKQGDWIFDTEGALCQANDGECTG